MHFFFQYREGWGWSIPGVGVGADGEWRRVSTTIISTTSTGLGSAGQATRATGGGERRDGWERGVSGVGGACDGRERGASEQAV